MSTTITAQPTHGQLSHPQGIGPLHPYVCPPPCAHVRTTPSERSLAEMVGYGLSLSMLSPSPTPMYVRQSTEARGASFSSWCRLEAEASIELAAFCAGGLLARGHGVRILPRRLVRKVGVVRFVAVLERVRVEQTCELSNLSSAMFKKRSPAVVQQTRGCTTVG